MSTSRAKVDSRSGASGAPGAFEAAGGGGRGAVGRGAVGRGAVGARTGVAAGAGAAGEQQDAGEQSRADPSLHEHLPVEAWHL
ncbi:hypothetical protein GCM10017752_45310 [Streptomyces roseoviridis]